MTIVSSSDSSAPLVVVTGAAGDQGGSVVAALQASSRPYRVRGIVRDPAKPAAKTLANKGVQVYVVNLVVHNKKAVFDAFRGADIAFLMTNFAEHLDKDREVAEGKLLIDATKAAGAKRVVWSSLEYSPSASNGRYPPADFVEGKAKVSDYGESTLPTGVFVRVNPGLYMKNVFKDTVLKLTPGANGTYELVSPVSADFVLPWLDGESDYGLFVQHAIEHPDIVARHGGAVFSASDPISNAEVATVLSQVTGKKVVYRQLPYEAYKAVISEKLPPAIANEFEKQWKSVEHIGYHGGHPLTNHDLLARKPHTWKEFAAAHAEIFRAQLV